MSEIKEIKEKMNLIEDIKKGLKESSFYRSFVFEYIDLYNKDKKNLIDFTCDVISSFEEATNLYFQVTSYKTPNFKLMKNTLVDEKHLITILDYLERIYPNIIFSQSEDYKTTIYISKTI
jgi:hypothetical protein